MNISSSKITKLLIPMNLNVFKRFTSDKTTDNEINNSYKKYKLFLDKEEKNIELLNNAFSEFAKVNIDQVNPSKIKKYRHSTKKISLNYPIFKLISKDKDKNNKSINKMDNIIVAKKLKNKKMKYNNIKLTLKNDINIDDNNMINNKFYNTFNNNLKHKIPNLHENKKSLLNYNNQINTLSSTTLNKEYNKYNNTDITNSNESIDNKKYHTRNNFLNKTSGLFNSFNKSKRILNFLEFYNINRIKNELNNNDKSNTINMNSLSYKTMNNIYQTNQSKNKLFFDIKEIKDINTKFKTKIEKTGIKQKIKAKTFSQRYKKQEKKFLANKDIQMIQYIRQKKQKSSGFFKLSQKMKNLAHKVIGNNYKREKSVAEEIKIRKKKEKNFYELVDNMLLNNNLYVYDINKIDKRLRLRKEEDIY